MTTPQHQEATETAEHFTPLNVPPTAVFYVSSQIRIHAPASLVFDTLTDTSTWPKWNTFVPDATVTPSPLQSPGESSKGKLHPGAKLQMSVRTFYPSESRDSATCIVHEIASPAETNTPGLYRARWDATLVSSWLLFSSRISEVQAVGDGGIECVFRTWEIFHGPVARIVKGVYPKQETLQSRFLDTARDLKSECERIK